MDQTSQGLSVQKILTVVRDGGGDRDTRRIDIELALRGVAVHKGILASMYELERVGLIEQTGAHTGPEWGLTAAGLEALRNAPTTE
jgi:hypothetical protein